MKPTFTDLDPRDWKAASRYLWVEPKYDGWFGRLELSGKQWHLYSRTDRLLEHGTLKRSIKPTTLLGEYLFGTQWAKSRPEQYGRIALFGCARLRGKQLDPHNDATRTILAAWLKQSENETLVERCFLVERFPASQCRRVWQQYVDGQDFEGLVFGGAHLARMKTEITQDYVCMGFEQSDSDRHGSWGVRSVIAGLYQNKRLVRVCSVGGINDEQRRQFHQQPNQYIGRVFEAAGKRLTKRGALRHPNFLRWRPDKDPNDCRIDRSV